MKKFYIAGPYVFSLTWPEYCQKIMPRTGFAASVKEILEDTNESL